MKHTFVGLSGFVASALVALSFSIVSAQTVTIGTIPASSFCSGDPISISFTATGYWQHKNAFTLQLSNDSGSFTSGFLNLASIKDTLPGTFAITGTLPGNDTPSLHYRFRIMAALPYVTSADNGSDIAIGQQPNVSISAPSRVITGNNVSFSSYSLVSDTFYWDFGSDATPPTAMGVGLWWDSTVVYAVGGKKTVTLRVVDPAGCSATNSITLYAYDCTPPVIPHYATVIDQDGEFGGGSTVLWVNPGVTLTLDGGSNTVFAESGSTINGGGGSNVVYLKTGAIDNVNSDVTVYAVGASPNGGGFLVSCPSLNFDYTNAPPNVAMPAGVSDPAGPVEITLAPNPTRSSIVVDGLPSNAREISVENVLGERVEEMNSSGASRMSIDLRQYSSGTYYLRFLSGATVVTKKIVLE